VGGTPPSIPTNGDAEAAVLNLTAVSGTADTFLSVFPPDGTTGACPYGGSNPSPPSSTINVSAHTTQANRVFVPLGPATSGSPTLTTEVCVYNAVGTINFILDANGWFGSASAATGKQYQAIGPSRIC